jgi:hypothetical protein
MAVISGNPQTAEIAENAEQRIPKILRELGVLRG